MKNTFLLLLAAATIALGVVCIVSLYLGSLAGGVVVGRFAPPAVQSLFADWSTVPV
jgi:hypothetical protein